jgi:hypothetical protein
LNQKKEKSEKSPPRPVDVSDGIPDRVETPSRRRLVLVLVIFAAWIAALLYFLLAARV